MTDTSGTKQVLNQHATVNPAAPRSQITVTGTGEYLTNPFFVLVEGDVCLTADPTPRHPHPVTSIFVIDQDHPGNPTESTFAAVVTYGPEDTSRFCDVTKGSTDGVSVGKLRVTITNAPTTLSAGADYDPSDNFDLDVDIESS